MAGKTFKGKISAQGTEITVLSQGTDDDYISLTDIARYKNPDEPNAVVANWLRNRNCLLAGGSGNRRSGSPAWHGRLFFRSEIACAFHLGH